MSAVVHWDRDTVPQSEPRLDHREWLLHWPANVATDQPVTATARSMADRSKAVSAALTLLPGSTRGYMENVVGLLTGPGPLCAPNLAHC